MARTGKEKKMNEQKAMKEAGSWDNYLANFLKSANVKDEKQCFPITNVEEVDTNDGKTIRLTLDIGVEKYLFDLNKTNAIFVKNSGINHPKNLIGKKIKFKKVCVTNPTTKKEVEGLRISEVA